jgi:hypothetical protein
MISGVTATQEAAAPTRTARNFNVILFPAYYEERIVALLKLPLQVWRRWSSTAQTAIKGIPVRRHPVVTFFALAIVFSWSIEVPLALQRQGQLPTSLPYALHYAAAFGPLLAAVLVTLVMYGSGGLCELGLGRFKCASDHAGG